jgi:hypothetical protein
MPAVNTEIDVWGPYLNTNWESVDGNIKIVADAAAAAATLAGTKAPAIHRHNFTDIDGTATTAQHADGSITNAKLENMPLNTVKGVTTAGVPKNLTVAELNSIIASAGPGTVPSHTHAIGDVTGLATALTDIATKEVQSAFSSTLALTDAGKMVTFTGATSVAVPTSVFSAGHRIDFINLSSGVVSFTGGTLRSFPVGANKMAGQYSGATIWFLSASEYVLVGNITV